MPEAELLFTFINAMVMPAWLLLVFAPRWAGTQKIVHSMLYPLLFGAFYIGIMIYLYAAYPANPEAGFTSIKGVQTLFSNPYTMLVGWVHYLVFDLFVGAWIARDSQRCGVNHFAVIPCLFFAFMFGPAGLFLYAVIRKLTKKGGWRLSET